MSRTKNLARELFVLSSKAGLVEGAIRCLCLSLIVSILTSRQDQQTASHRRSPILLASAHVVLTRDDRGQSLVLSGEDSKKEDGDQLVIAGNNMDGNGQSSNMIMEDAANREGDIVMNGRSMIIPGEDGHIVLADSRRNDADSRGPPMQPWQGPLMFWSPYMGNRMFYRMMPFFG